MVGGWNILKMEPCNLPQKLATGFAKVVGDIDGASYEPLLYCATQIVNGTNHMLICKQTLVTNPPSENIVKMILHETLDGNFIILSIESIM